jgi:hypothetical protein
LKLDLVRGWEQSRPLSILAQNALQKMVFCFTVRIRTEDTQSLISMRWDALEACFLGADVDSQSSES